MKGIIQAIKKHAPNTTHLGRVVSVIRVGQYQIEVGKTKRAMFSGTLDLKEGDSVLVAAPEGDLEKSVLLGGYPIGIGRGGNVVV